MSALTDDFPHAPLIWDVASNCRFDNEVMECMHVEEEEDGRVNGRAEVTQTLRAHLRSALALNRRMIELSADER